MRTRTPLIVGLATVLTSMVLVEGCDSPAPNANQVQPTHAVKSHNDKANGTIASMTLVTKYNKFLPKNTKMYKMFYWSDGKKDEAYVTEPTGSGRYPLLMSLHGGSIVPSTTSTLGYQPEDVAKVANSFSVDIYPDSSVYRELSPNIDKITAPVLLLQGTGDKRVSWQVVQSFAKQMKQHGKMVKLVLYPGGQHGLHGKYQKASSQQIDQWLRDYGF